ncbi:MAG TPA: DUF6231 family protein [Gammaproteobacteria bacterium]
MREAEPKRLLAVTASTAAVALDAFAAERPDALVRRFAPGDALDAAATDAPYDLGLLGDVVGVLPDAAAGRLIGALRDRFCRRVLLLAPAGRWRLASYLAFGFERREAGEGWELYWYDVDRYNPEREWNNPTHWANPENFKRYRW